MKGQIQTLTYVKIFQLEHTQKYIKIHFKLTFSPLKKPDMMWVFIKLINKNWDTAIMYIVKSNAYPFWND